MTIYILCVLKNMGGQDDKLYIVYCRTWVGKMINYTLLVLKNMSGQDDKLYICVLQNTDGQDDQLYIVYTEEHGWAR